MPLPGEAKPDWWTVTQVARRMGFAEAFGFNSAADIFREHAALSTFENNGTRDFDIGALASLSDGEFNALDPVQWPAPVGAPRGETRFFADGRFFTASRKAQLIAPARPQPNDTATAQYPLRLNTGRIRDQWHTMTRSGLSPKLSAHLPEPFVEVHADDAAAAGVTSGGFARVTSCYGSCVLKVLVSDGQRRRSLFAPIHWSNETASSARIGDLVTPATDPYSGQPEAKATPVSIEPVDYAFRGFALSRTPLALPTETWWSKVTVATGAGFMLASNQTPAMWRGRAQSLFGGEAELAEYVDELRGSYRAAAFVEGRLTGCLFIGPAGATSQWDAVKALFEAEALGDAQRRAVLSGKSTDGLADPGPVICACFGVGLNVIRAALESGAAANVDDIGKALRAGTNCGSCLPELKRIVAHGRVAQTV